MENNLIDKSNRFTLSATDRFCAFYADHNDQYEKVFSSSNEKHLQAALYSESIRENFPEAKREFSILDIGCGSGTITELLARTWRARNPSVAIKLTAVDPAAGSIEGYKRTMSHIDGVVVEAAHVSCAEDFCKEAPTAFDIVLCDHCFYSINIDVIDILLAKWLKSDGLLLASMASQAAPVSLYRKSKLGIDLAYSEQFLRRLLEGRYAFGHTRYHSEFNVQANAVFAAASWICMTDMRERSAAEAVLESVGVKTSGANYQFRNVADCFSILPPHRNCHAKLVSLFGRLASREVKLCKAKRLSNELTPDFRTGLRGVLGFHECGALVTDQHPRGGDIRSALTMPFLFSGSRRGSENESEDIRNELADRLKWVSRTGVFGSADDLGDKSRKFDQLKRIQDEYIKKAVARSSKNELGDELKDFFKRAGPFERRIGVLWIEGGEHTLYCMLPLLNTADGKIDWRTIVADCALAATEGEVGDHFVPSKRFLRLVRWTRRLVMEDKVECAAALDDLRKALIREGMRRIIQKIPDDAQQIEANWFEQFLRAIVRSNPIPRAVSAVCYLIAAGMRSEVPNLLIFPVASFASSRRAYGFVTSIDLDEHWSGDPNFGRPARSLDHTIIERIILLVQLFKQLFYQSVIEAVDERIQLADLTDKLLEKLMGLINEVQSGGDVMSSVRGLVAEILTRSLDTCPVGGNGGLYERVVETILKVCLDRYGIEIRRHFQVLGRAGVVDLVIVIQQTNCAFVKTLKEEYGSHIAIECKNLSTHIARENIGQLNSYVDSIGGSDRKRGLLICRDKTMEATASQMITDLRNRGVRLRILSDKELRELINAFGKGEHPLERQLVKLLIEDI